MNASSEIFARSPGKSLGEQLSSPFPEQQPPPPPSGPQRGATPQSGAEPRSPLTAPQPLFPPADRPDAHRHSTTPPFPSPEPCPPRPQPGSPQRAPRPPGAEDGGRASPHPALPRPRTHSCTAPRGSRSGSRFGSRRLQATRCPAQRQDAGQRAAAGPPSSSRSSAGRAADATRGMAGSEPLPASLALLRGQIDPPRLSLSLSL